MVTRKLLEDDELLGHKLPAGTMVVLHLQATHNMWAQPEAFRPERFLDGGEYDSFDDAVRAYMFVPFIQVPPHLIKLTSL